MRPNSVCVFTGQCFTDNEQNKHIKKYIKKLENNHKALLVCEVCSADWFCIEARELMK